MTYLSDYYSTGRTSPFGDCRPVGSDPCGRRHRGQDFSHSNRSGTIPVPALLSGTVVSKTAPSSQHGFGWGTTIRSQYAGYTLDISYSHGPWASSQGVGEHVDAGQAVLHEGLSGFTDGPCCHIEVYVHGVGYVDPLPWITRILIGEAPASTGSSTPVSDQSEEDDDVKIFYSEHLGRTFLIGPKGITHLVGGAAEAYNAIGVKGNSNQNKVGKGDMRMIAEGLGVKYDDVRNLAEGQMLTYDGKVISAGFDKWPGQWN